eukprot:scaffold56007_cov65-Phaeocystis_antarctica.AAC.5
MVHAAHTQHETIPGPHDVRATLGGVFNREHKRREQYKQASHHTDELSDGVGWRRAFLALGALRVVPLKLTLITGITESAERALVSLAAVITAVSAGLIAATARRELSLVNRLEGHVGKAYRVNQTWQALDGGGPDGGGLLLQLRRQEVVLLAAITAAAAGIAPSVVDTRFARLLTDEVRGLPHSPCRARRLYDRSLGAEHAQGTVFALAVIVKPLHVAPRAREAIQLLGRSFSTKLSRATLFAVVLALFVLVFAFLAVCAKFAFCHIGIRADSARLHFCAAFWASCPARARVTVGGAMQQWPLSHPPCWTILRRWAAHRAERPILARYGNGCSSTARIPCRAHPRTSWGDWFSAADESPTVPAGHANGKSPRTSPGMKR